jgi:hypothetical protein
MIGHSRDDCENCGGHLHGCVVEIGSWEGGVGIKEDPDVDCQFHDTVGVDEWKDWY